MSKIAYMHLRNIDCSYIKSGKKTIELRLFDEKRSAIEIGETIIFTNVDNSQDIFSVIVIGVSRFANFRDLLTQLDPIKCGWDEVIDIEDMVKQMRVYYSEDEENKYGVVGLHLKYNY